MNNSPAILYVEDEKSDALLMRLAVEHAGLPNPLRVAVDGVEAIAYLAGTGAFANRKEHPLPCLVLLDLKLPRKTGFEVLAWTRQQPQFAGLPVIVYTSSSSDADRNKARELGATDYMTKMSDIFAMAQWIRGLGPLCMGETTSPPT